MAVKKQDVPKWTTGLLTKTFRLERILEEYAPLNAWLDTNGMTINETDKLDLERWRKMLLKNYNSWNEETLKMRFIALLLDKVNYDSDVFHYQGIFESEVHAELEGQKLSTIADFLVATMIEDLVEAPYFYFHEYKRKKRGSSDDPIAQILVAMLAAQVQNKNEKPVYGCYVIGEGWYFMVMQHRKYAISKAFDATDSMQLAQILLVLRKFKIILETELLSL